MALIGQTARTTFTAIENGTSIKVTDILFHFNIKSLSTHAYQFWSMSRMDSKISIRHHWEYIAHSTINYNSNVYNLQKLND